MYNGLLSNVINIVNSTVKTSSTQDVLDEMTSKWSDPQKHEYLVRRRHQREDLGNKIIMGAGILAVGGEIFNVVKKSDTVRNLFKK